MNPGVVVLTPPSSFEGLPEDFSAVHNGVMLSRGDELEAQS